MTKYELLYLPSNQIKTRRQIFESAKDAFEEALRMERAGEIYPDAWEISKVEYDYIISENIKKEILKDAAARI